jgi:alginate O-acetyltransferase complex protein AlgI
VSAYLPAHPVTVWAGTGLLAATLLAGFAVSRIRRLETARWAAWGLVLVVMVAAERLTASEPPGFRMLGLIGALLYAMKAVVTVETRAAGDRPLGPARWFAFAAAWPGMRPALFAGTGPRRGGGALVRQGLARLLAGVLLFGLARWAWLGTESLVLSTVLTLPALSLILHFGIFNLLAGAWRLAGIDARPLFRAPLRSRSLTEFWGRRWNLAFSEMTAIAVYRPLATPVGRPVATAAAFVASGLLHELAISLPVLAGFGLPSLYFTLQGGLMLVERALERAGRPVHRWPWLGRAWTFGWLVLPLPILFHRPFLAGVVWPLLGPGR